MALRNDGLGRNCFYNTVRNISRTIFLGLNSNLFVRCFTVLFLIIYMIILSPYILYDQLQRQRKLKIEAGYIRLLPEPDPLPLQSLKRRISHTRMNFSSRENEKIGLVNLPWELKEVIYQELGVGLERVIHWNVKNGKLRGIVCADPLGHTGRGPNEEIRWWSTMHPFGPEARFDALPLMLSCRHLYIEIVEMLYRRNTFVTDEPDVIAYLDRFLPPQHIDRIHRLKFRWNMECPPSWSRFGPTHVVPLIWQNMTPESIAKETDAFRVAWYHCWRSLIGMNQLVYLRIELNIRYSLGWIPGDLSVANEIRGVKRFELVMPEQQRALVMRAGDLRGSTVELLGFGRDADRDNIRLPRWLA